MFDVFIVGLMIAQLAVAIYALFPRKGKGE